MEIRDRNYPAGTTFGLLYGSANRDPAKFENPDIFDIDRSPNQHLSFGPGAHLCLGNNLARLNMKVIFGTLLLLFKNIALADQDVVYKRGLAVRGPEALLIEWTRN